jgi:hypothetical protein
VNIIASFDPLPIPDRRHDWTAIDADSYDPEPYTRRNVIGEGATKGEAIADLIEQLEDRHV